jgi:DNA-binding NtrC family response regulator
MLSDRTSVRTAHHTTRLSPKAFALSVVEGPDKGLTFLPESSTETRILIGTSPVCTLRLTDPMVSRRHLQLEICDGGLRVTDLESTNGTMVDGVRIHCAQLSDMQRIRIGDTLLRVHSIASHESQEPKERLTPALSFGRFIGRSPLAQKVMELARRQATSSRSLLIEGEAGSGKELLAEAIHEASPRAAGPFIVLDAAATADVDLQLFGAVTPEGRLEVGLLERARGGTLVIDSPAAIPLAIQDQLVAALERGFFRPRGRTAQVAIDVRIVSLSRIDLDREVQDGRLREGLYFRLCSACISVPPLRARREDVNFIAEALWLRLRDEGADMPADVLSAWDAYEWPGNVRELEHVLLRSMSSTGSLMVPRKLSATPTASEQLFSAAIDVSQPYASERQRVLASFEQCYTEAALKHHGNNLTRAAACSGLARRYFQTLRAKHRTGE